jgi:DNA-binding CsgD family transcriptional regulator
MDRLDYIARFAVEAEAATDLETLREALLDHLQRLGFAWFAYEGEIPTGNAAHKIVINNYPPDWIDHYLAENYGPDDAVLNYAASQTRPFTWTDSMRETPPTNRQRKVFREAREADLCSGGLIPLHGPGKIRGTFAVASSLGSEAFAEVFAARRYELHLLAHYFHSQIVEGRLAVQPHYTIRLTPREKQVLTHTAQGRARGEIATALGIQEPTVKDHLERVTRKFRAKNKTHAAVLAQSMGLIHL